MVFPPFPELMVVVWRSFFILSAFVSYGSLIFPLFQSCLPNEIVSSLEQRLLDLLIFLCMRFPYQE